LYEIKCVHRVITSNQFITVSFRRSSWLKVKQESSASAQNTARSEGSVYNWMQNFNLSLSHPVKVSEEANTKWVVSYSWSIVTNPLASFLRYD